jgi:hypothetical protein
MQTSELNQKPKSEKNKIIYPTSCIDHRVIWHFHFVALPKKYNSSGGGRKEGAE